MEGHRTGCGFSAKFTLSHGLMYRTRDGPRSPLKLAPSSNRFISQSGRERDPMNLVRARITHRVLT